MSASHRRVDACAECGQRWPCDTERADRESVARRCGHTVVSSGKPCNRKANFGDYCRAHYWLYEADAGFGVWKRERAMGVDHPAEGVQ